MCTKRTKDKTAFLDHFVQNFLDRFVQNRGKAQKTGKGGKWKTEQ
jgi:hypothetical protein